MCIRDRSRHRESFIELVEDYIDILFANEDEITTLYKTSNLNLAIEKLKKKCDLAAITIGKKGSIIITNGKEITIEPFILGKAIRRAIESYEEDLNVVVFGTGGMSHQLQYKRAGLINSEWDARFLYLMTKDPVAASKISHLEYLR